MVFCQSFFFGMMGPRSIFVKHVVNRITYKYSFVHNSSSAQHSAETFPDYLKLCGPSVKKLVSDYGINFTDVKGSGPRENILKGDILMFIQKNNLKKKPISSEKPKVSSTPDLKITRTKTHIDIQMSDERKTIAGHLLHSKANIPHAYMTIDCKISKVFEYVKSMKSEGTDVFFDDFLIKSAAIALRKVPKLNVISEHGKIKFLNSVDISINIANDSGFVAPVIKNADNLTVDLISKEVILRSKDADKWNLNGENLPQGTFRIQNLGLSSITESSAVIHPPEVAVLTIGSVQYALEGDLLLEKIKATLSFNNEIIQENEAGQFLNSFKENLENPLSVCLF